MFRKIRDRMSEIENERVNNLGELESLRQDFRKRTLARSIFWMNFQRERPTSRQLRARFLRWLFEALGLKSVTGKPSNWTNCRVTLSDQDMDQLAADSGKLVRRRLGTQERASIPGRTCGYARRVDHRGWL